MNRASPKRRVTIAVLVSSAGLADRLLKAIGDQPDLEVVDSAAAADIAIVEANRLAEIDRPAPAIVLLGNGARDLPELSPRALLPAEADAALIVAAARLVALGLFVLPDSNLDPPAAPDAADAENGPAEGLVQLTPREKEVLELLAAGASNKVIARRMGISVHTAKFHVASLLRKLGASGRLEAVGIGLRTGLLML